MSMMQALIAGFGSVAQSLSFITSASSTISGSGTASTIVIPATAAIGDLAVLFEMNFSGGAATYTTGAPAAPTGFTSINSANAGAITSGVGVVSSYKVLVSGDPGATVTCLAGGGGGGGGARNLILIFRPAKSITTVTPGGASGQATTASPTNQTLTGGTAVSLYCAHWGANSTITTRGSTLTMTEVVGADTFQYSKYLIYNTGATSSSTISTNDVGTNGMQSFYVNVV